MSWLDQFLTAIGQVQDGGTPLIQRPTINFVLPPGGSVVDDPTTKVTTVTVPTASTTATQINAKAVAVGNLTLSGAQTIDGVSCGVGDVVLVVGQTSAPENGLWVVAFGTWARTTDTLVSGMVVFVQLGTVYGHTRFQLKTTGTISVGTTPLIFQLVATSPRMDNVRDFAPFPAFLGQGNALSNLPLYMLTDLFANHTAAEAAFPLIAGTGELSATNFATASYDWAVIQEAIRYAEAHLNATVWLDHAVYDIVSGLEASQASLTFHSGIHFIGQGSQGSNQLHGTVFFHYSTGGFIQCDATNGIGHFDEGGTGFGLKNFVAWKANRLSGGGINYQGGKGVYIVATATDARPGEMLFENVGFFTQGGLVDPATWEYGLYIDGSALRTYGGAGVRTLHTNKFRTSGNTLGAVFLNYVEHYQFTGLETELGNGTNADVTIVGDSNNINFSGSRVHGAIVLKATTATSITAMDVSAVVTSAGHGFPVGQYVNVFVDGTGGTTGINGLQWVGQVLSSSTIQLLTPGSLAPISGAGYTSGGTIRSTAPREVHIDGVADVLSVIDTDSTGTAELTHDLDPTRGQQSGSTWISASPYFKCSGPWTPAFVLEQKSAVTNQTGEGTTYVVTFDTITLNENSDDFGAGPPYGAWVCTAAGHYKFYANILLSGVAGNLIKYIEITITQQGAFKATKRYPAPPPGLAPGSEFMSLDIESPPLVVQKSDVIRVQVTAVGIAVTNASNATPIVCTTDVAHNHMTGDSVTVSGVTGNTAANGTWTITVTDTTHFSLDTSVGSGAYAGGGTIGTKTVGVYGDSGSAYTRFSGEML